MLDEFQGTRPSKVPFTTQETNMKRKLTVCLCLLLCTTLCMGQLRKSRLGSGSKDHIAFSVGINYPMVGLAQPMVGPSAEFNYTHYFIPRLGLRGQLGYNWLTGHYAAGNLYSAQLVDLDVEAVFNYYVFQGGRSENNAFTAAPERCYIFAGVGGMGYFTNTPDNAKHTNMGGAVTFPVGTGIQWAIGDSWTFGLDFAWHFVLTNQTNTEGDGKIKDGFPTLSLAFTYKIPDFDMPAMESYLAASPQRNKIESPKSNAINRGNRNKIEYHSSNKINQGNRNKIEYHSSNKINRGNRNKIEYHTSNKINRGNPNAIVQNKAYRLNRGGNKVAGIKTYKVNRGGHSRVDNRRAYSNRSYRHRPMNAKKLYKKGVRHMHCDPRKGCTFTFD